MKKLIPFMFLICSLLCCEQKVVYYSDEFLIRFTTTDVYPGCLFIPVTPDGKSFTVMDNDDVRGRLYYDNYLDSFPSYRVFLNTLMNEPGIIDIKKSLGFIKTYESKEIIAKEADGDFTRFMNKYLKQNKDYFVIGDLYKDNAIYIARECFIKGYYVFEPSCFSDWIISPTPEICPPLME